ncbi:MAG: histidine phosphatase family protein [Oscillospiraceae bacterium]|jgi:alpha-ribazole phosphatase
MKGYRLKIIRHGKTDANSTGMYVGITDIPLNEQGKHELYEKKEQHDYESVQKVYSSPLTRCLDTAEILFPDTLIFKVNEMREMNFGSFEGKTADQLILLPEFKEWLKGGADNAPPYGEALTSVMERTFEGFDFIIQDMMSEGLTSCALVTHSGIIMNSLACFGLPKAKPMEFSCDFGEGFELLFSASMWQRSSAFEIIGKYPYTNIEPEEN